jgi:hypothetical protein
MQRSDKPAPDREEPRPAPLRDKPATIPPYLDDDKVELVSWDAPLVPRD